MSERIINSSDTSQNRVGVEEKDIDNGGTQDAHFGEGMRLRRASSYHSDAQGSDLATLCSGSVQKDIDAESLYSAHYDQRRETLSTEACPLNPEACGDSRRCTDETGDVLPVRFSISGGMKSGSDASTPLYQLGQEHPSESNLLGIATQRSHPGELGYQRESESFNVSDGPFQPHQYIAIRPIVPTSNPFSVTSHQYHDEVKPPAPSSVKSFGSNLGSEDCGGSLDVETHSIDARSVDETLPVAMLEHDPEIVAVASLSICPIEGSEVDGFPNTYISQGLHRFQQRSASLQFNGSRTNGVAYSKLTNGDSQEGDMVYSHLSIESHSVESLHFSIRKGYDDRATSPLSTDRNQFRIDNQPSRENSSNSRSRWPQNDDRTRSRSRSRSISPPKDS